MKQPDLYYFEDIRLVTRPVKFHREHLPAARIFHTKFECACDVILWLQISIDQAVS